MDARATRQREVHSHCMKGIPERYVLRRIKLSNNGKADGQTSQDPICAACDCIVSNLVARKQTSLSRSVISC